jgi:hypothetical protein
MRRCEHGVYIPEDVTGENSPGCSGCTPVKGWGTAAWGSSPWGGGWEQVLKDAGLGMTVGERTDFLSNAGDNLETIITLESAGKQFDYTLATKPADRRKYYAKAAALSFWQNISAEDKARHIERMRAGLDPVKAAHALWDNASPEIRQRCLSGLAHGRTSEAALKRWHNRTPEQKDNALAILAAGRKKYVP